MEQSTEKRCLSLCVGSTCHQLGVYDVLPQIQALLKHYHLDTTVELTGAFCLGPCAQGIVMKYGETCFTHISPENVKEKFTQEILPHLLP